MRTRYITTLFIGAVILAGIVGGSPAAAQGVIADHRAVDSFESIPMNWIDSVSRNIQMYYLHQSHGSQIMQGMAIINSIDSRYYPHRMEAEWWLYPNGLEIGQSGDTAWARQIRTYLDTNSVHCNLVSMSWCSGAPTLDSLEMVKFLRAWRNLERDYPAVTFVYQTSRLTKIDWPESYRLAVLRSNAQIRKWCADSSCYLMDYGAIEGHLPDGTYDPYATDSCTTWCGDYCQQELLDCPECVTDTFDGIWNRSSQGPTNSCAHATNDVYGGLVCYRKGMAWWWLMARVAGWMPQPANCGDVNGDGGVNVADGVFMINYIFKNGPPPAADNIGDVNSDLQLNVGDAVYLIQYVFKSGTAPVCPGM